MTHEIEAPDGVDVLDTTVRMRPMGPTGPGVQPQGRSMLELGSIAGARGLTNAQVQRLFSLFQDLAIGAMVDGAHQVLNAVQDVTDSQILEIAEAIKRLPAIQIQAQPPTLWQQFTRQTNIVPPQPLYVSMDSVLAIVNAALGRRAR